MELNEALKQIKFEYALYFKYKFPDLRFDQSEPVKTEKEFLKSVQRKSMNSFKRWERTQEYKALVTLYLSTKAIKDYEEIYQIVSEQAKKGEEKSIKLFIALQKDIQSQSKLATSYFNQVDEVEDDDLELEV
ncbi:hypothetical protein [Rummeliibacillus sp. POC4]|uniref:hypothetical protein n=1 Tax=Rummeliibacillus sp. POC4 TaxID=2305899 RepID=UPI000E670781|nr:hypothetical protein [Rummeliibacillus sp. POC4]RIJ65309.1 hypothetical protein D1606_08280 [Rummeliibacillus sp. POC4]